MWGTYHGIGADCKEGPRERCSIAVYCAKFIPEVCRGRSEIVGTIAKIFDAVQRLVWLTTCADMEYALGLELNAVSELLLEEIDLICRDMNEYCLGLYNNSDGLMNSIQLAECRRRLDHNSSNSFME